MRLVNPNIKITKCDLLKGYGVNLYLSGLKIYLTTFVTNDGLYQYKVKPFGVKIPKLHFRDYEF